MAIASSTNKEPKRIYVVDDKEAEKPRDDIKPKVVSDLIDIQVASHPLSGFSVVVTRCPTHGRQEFLFSNPKRAIAARDLILYEKNVYPEAVDAQVAA